MKMEVMTCSLCGRKVRGPAFWRHSDACRVKHGQRSGKVWRATARRVAKKMAGLLRALAKSPAEHQEDLFGPGKGPQDVLDALELATTRRELTWAMSWAWGWRNLLETDTEKWPEAERKAIWDHIWTAYVARHKQLRGRAPLIDRQKYGVRQEGR